MLVAYLKAGMAMVRQAVEGAIPRADHALQDGISATAVSGEYASHVVSVYDASCASTCVIFAHGAPDCEDFLLVF
jgi:hypothetical protein